MAGKRGISEYRNPNSGPSSLLLACQHRHREYLWRGQFAANRTAQGVKTVRICMVQQREVRDAKEHDVASVPKPR